jgi:hypothetical protein
MARPRQTQNLYRLLKWVGDPVLVKEDGFGVPNWKYENNRVMAGFRSRRILRKGDGGDLTPIEWDENGNVTKYKRDVSTGISRDYVWEKENKSRIVEVSFRDAQIILRVQGNEFKDVTDEARPEKVRNDVIVVKSKRKGGAASVRS